MGLSPLNKLVLWKPHFHLNQAEFVLSVSGWVHGACPPWLMVIEFGNNPLGLQ